MDVRDFSGDMWADLAEVIFQGIELSEYEQMLREEQSAALAEQHLALPPRYAEDFEAMFFNRYGGMKNNIPGREAVVAALAALLETALTFEGDPAAVASEFREQMMQYIPQRNEMLRKGARTLLGDYMEEE